MATVMHKFFNSLESRGVNYVHFKSNSNLDKSFAGYGDFDVLVDSARLWTVENLLGDLDAKRFNPVEFGRYPGVDNWLLYDANSGIIYHLHLHYQLCTGKALVKDYVLPWASYIFETRNRDEQFGIYVTRPDVEVVLLLARMVVKRSGFDCLKTVAGGYLIPKPMKEELGYLLDIADPAKIEQSAKLLLSEELGAFVVGYLVQMEKTGKIPFSVSRKIRRALSGHRRMSGLKASVSSFVLRIRKLFSLLLSRKLNRPQLTRKTSLSGGRIIAFIGVDGAGKSSTSKTINQWLGKKIECSTFYMGTGDGKTPLSVALIKGIRQSFEWLRPCTDEKEARAEPRTLSNGKSSAMQPKVKKGGFVRKISRYSSIKMILSVEKSNRRKIIKMNKYRMNGGICVLDRYPQLEVRDCNDGPKVRSLATGFFKDSFIEKMVNKEEKEMNIVQLVKPDLVIRLNISPETSMLRKPDQTNIDVYRRKAETLKSISFCNSAIVDINAEQPYEKELLEIKKLIWSVL